MAAVDWCTLIDCMSKWAGIQPDTIYILTLRSLRLEYYLSSKLNITSLLFTAACWWKLRKYPSFWLFSWGMCQLITGLRCDLITISERYYSVPMKLFLKPGFRTSFPLIRITIFRKFGVLPGREPTIIRNIRNFNSSSFAISIRFDLSGWAHFFLCP